MASSSVTVFVTLALVTTVLGQVSILPNLLFQAFMSSLNIDGNQPEVVWIPGTGVALVEYMPNRTTRSFRRKYYVGSVSGDFSEVDIYCTAAGQKLLTIKNHVEQEDVEQLLADYNVRGNVWLRGVCLNNVWTWGDGTRVNKLFNRLSRNSIDCDTNGQNLMMFGPGTPLPYTYTWGGEKGSEQNYFVCTS